MMDTFEKVLPQEIENRSFDIITEELGGREFHKLEEPIIKRCIHTSADFDYADNLVFSKDAVEIAIRALQEGVPIVTDTNMGKAGINKAALSKAKGQVYCFMSDADIAKKAKEEGSTRAAASMDKAAATLTGPIIAVGNAPTALIRLFELIKNGNIKPALIIGVPVGFVNVVAAKELIMEANCPYIVARGRKGGSNIAAAICNALLYMAVGR